MKSLFLTTILLSIPAAFVAQSCFAQPIAFRSAATVIGRMVSRTLDNQAEIYTFTDVWECSETGQCNSLPSYMNKKKLCRALLSDIQYSKVLSASATYEAVEPGSIDGGSILGLIFRPNHSQKISSIECEITQSH